ncbi:MAG TPA: RHS repeat-associated core domain-containing protein [Candidatus Bathyarchaeia archaeon]|nr:RHS repeat-associated core domain-containing protein [Candidatus Bathyarchaeia archaeon]
MDLTSVTDPIGRVTSYSYGSNPWLIAQITYSTGWYTAYSYVSALLGTQATTYRVSLQQVMSGPTSTVRQFGYSYAPGVGDQLIGSTVTSYDGTQITSYTKYAFSFLAYIKNVTDANGRLVSGNEQFFGVNGQIAKEVVITTSQNEWYWTKTTPANGWNSLTNFSQDSSWALAPVVAAYGGAPWNTIPGWQDTGAKWIWWNPDAATSSTTEPVWFRTVINAPTAGTYFIEMTVDNSYTLYVDGGNIASDTNWSTRKTYNVNLGAGNHVVAIAAGNSGGPAGLLFSMGRILGTDITARTDISAGGYTNYYSYDLWGNQIYSRRAINPSTNFYQESFSGYYNNGEPPAFYAFQDSFSKSQGSLPDNSWNATGGNWQANNGVYTGTEVKGAEDAMFSWADIGIPNISIQAKVNVVTQTNSTTPRVGILTHYPKTGSYKWGLVFYSGSLYLLDEWKVWLAGVPCPLILGVWYTLNMTVNGYSATGWASTPGQATCTVSGTFSTNSPAAGGTAFGLYSGAYTAVFDDVQVATVSPSITGSGFSNSFLQSRTPGPTGINTWLATTKSPGTGWNSATDWLPASGWIQAYASQNYGAGPWGTITGWPDNSAQWIWWQTGADVSATTDPVWLRRVFSLSTAMNLNIAITVDNTYTLYLDGLQLGSGSNWQQTDSYSTSVAAGLHVLAIYATNISGPAGLLVSVKNANTGQVLFRSDATAGPNIVTTAGTAQLMNGPGSMPEETYYGYTQWGGVSQTNQAYGGDPSQVQISITAWPTTDQYGRSWGLTTDQPLPVPWWPTYEVTTAGSNYTYTTSRSFSNGVHYIEFGISGFLPNGIYGNYAWHARIFVNGYLRAEADVGRFNHLRAYFIVGTQWLSTSATYDVFGNPKTSTDQLGNAIYYTFGGPNYAYLTNQTQLSGSTRLTSLFTYDNNFGTMLSTNDPNGNMATYQYDLITRPTKVNYPLQAYISYNYNDAANYVEITNENGLDTRQIYDGLGRLYSIQRFSGGILYSTATTTYNWIDKVSSRTDPLGNTYQYQYDVLGRITRTTKPDGNTTQVSYNDIQSQVILTNEYGNSRCTASDFLGRKVTVTEYSDSICQPKTFGGSTYVTTYNYDLVGNLRSSTTAKGQTTTYVYDNLNSAIGTNNPDGTFTFAGYDLTGRIIKSINQNNVASLYSYDSAGRLLTVTHCGSTITSDNYSYDKNGNTLTLQNQNATISYSYDARNRVIAETWSDNPSSRNIIDLGCLGSPGSWTVTGGSSNTDTISYTYNGELTNTIVYPGVTAQYAYDRLGRPVSVLHAGTGIYLATVSYYPNDQVKGIQYGNGLLGNYTYDQLGRYSTIKLANGGTTMMLLTYNYNKTGSVSNLTGQVNQASVSEKYAYDPLQRIINANAASSGVSNVYAYQYDNIGNMLSQTMNGVQTTFSYNTQNNELISSSAPGTSISYSYDNNGNLLTKSVTTSGTVNWSYSWDAANHLLKVTNSTGQVQYAYDAMGRRAVASESGTTTFFAYQGTNISHKRLLYSDKYAYISIAGLRVSMIISTTSRYYFHTDALGSTRMMTWQNAGMVYVNNYQPFGQDNGSPQGAFANRAVDKFTGKPYSSATGLYYYYQRWYDPSTGRFISPDPRPGKLSNPQSLNLYIYVLDIPTSLTEPTGLDGCWIFSSVCSGAITVWNGANATANIFTSGVNAVVDKWNNDAEFRTIVISVAVIVVVGVATGGLGLAVAPVLIGGLSGAGISGAFYAATCGGSSSGCSAKGFAAAALSGGALGALGGVAGPLAGGFGTARLGLTGASAALFTRGASGGIMAVVQGATDLAGGKSTGQTASDIFIAFGFGAMTGSRAPMASTDMYSTISLAREFSRDIRPGTAVSGGLESGIVSGVWDNYFVPYLGW